MKKKLFSVLLFFLIINPVSLNAQYTLLTDFTGPGTFSGGDPLYDQNLISVGGAMYGMTRSGGANNFGTLFKINPDGTGFTKLLDFAGAANGSRPCGSLISDGTSLYGMTQFGGANGQGTLFKINLDGTGYTKLLDFAGVSNGRNPIGSLISDGTSFYGMTLAGGANDLGTLFKINPDGTGYTKLLDFAGAANGSNPYGSLISDGTSLYGMTQSGGANNFGTLFKINPDGTGYTKLLDFAGASNGRDPHGSLISDGTSLYGMTRLGGANNQGTLFKINPDGTGYTKLLDFDGATNGSGPYGSLVSDGTSLYGMTINGGANNLGTLFKINPDGTGYTKLLDFAGATNGRNPYGSLISDGTSLYGMTRNGGANNLGTLFKINPDGTGYTKLLDFAGASNGRYPQNSLISDGTSLYGMTVAGGANDFGTLFKINPDGTGYTKLLDFAGASNGRNPFGSLVSDGTSLYGMTRNGGANNFGTIFKINPDGTGYTKLLDFAGATNGRDPYGSLISDGTSLYGMTRLGGANNMGTIFKINPDGTGYTKLLDFDGATNGRDPYGSLISDGTSLYGMTINGGANNFGTIFKINPDGTGYTKLLDFAGATNGRNPYGSLISDGTSLYGMTINGGANNLGTLFKINPDGTGYTKLLDFAGTSNGRSPYGSLISDGTYLYGMTVAGGANDFGTLFKINPDGTGYTKLLDFAGATNGSNPHGSLILDGTSLYGMTRNGGSANVGSVFKYQECSPTSGTDVITACDSYTWIDGNTYTSSNNIATQTLTNVAGCDSVVTLDLTINNSITGTDEITACDSYTWIDGNTYTSDNNSAQFTLTNVDGCDSIVTLDLTINNSNTGTDVITACDSYTWIDGNTYTSSNNIATQTLTNVAGCDSVVTLDLTINNSNTGTDVITACDSYTWVDGNTYTSDNNTAQFTLTNVDGCDSIVTLDLTINNSNTGTDVITACDSYTWIDGNTYTSSNNTAQFTLPNVAGCDSIVTVDLTINNSNTGTDVITACDSYTWIDGNTYTTSNNTATHTLTNVDGCDSIVTLDLTINNSNTGTDVITACDSYTWIDGNTYTSSNNTAQFTLTNVDGCDSIVTLDLTINNSNTGTDVITACDSYTWIDGNTYTSSNNTAQFTLTNVDGCDSIVTLDLTINNSNTGTDEITACDSYTWIDGNTYTTNNNTATHTLTNVAGCDSIVTLDLTINNSNTGTDVITACDSYTWIDGNTYTSSNNSAQFTLTNVDGCDSIVTLDLTIGAGIDTEVSLVVNSDNDIVLIAEQENAQYQWLDCDDDYAVLNNSNNQTFLVSENGNYAVQITQASCSDTSECFVVNNVSITKNEKPQINFYPNPSNGIFTLESDLIGESYTIIDSQGRLIQSGKIESQQATISLEEEVVGVYYLKVENTILKMVKR